MSTVTTTRDDVARLLGFTPMGDCFVLLTYPYKGARPGVALRVDLDADPKAVADWIAYVTPESWRLVSFSPNPIVTEEYAYASDGAERYASTVSRYFRHSRRLTTMYEAN